MNERKKRLCIIIPGHWSRIMGGSQYQVKCLIEELKKNKRFEIFYLTRDSDPNYNPNGYNLIRYAYPGVNKRGTHRHLIEMALFPKLLKKIKPEIIYQRVGCGQTGLAARYAIQNQCNMIWHVASENDLSPLKISLSRLMIERAVDRWLLNYGIYNSSKVIVQTEDQKMLLRKRFGRESYAVIPNFHPAPKEVISKKDPIKVVWVSNLKNIKRPEIFLRLAKDLQGITNVRFVMIGAIQETGRAKKACQKQIEQTKNLRYLGAISQNDVNLILAESHILINTSLHEGFPNTFVQSWMRQVPVISLNVNPDRLIEKHQMGLVSGSYEKLKKDVIKLVKSPILRKQMGLNGQKFALKFFSIKNAETLIKILEK
jgi:glycosyltransferase involved in cell wall biosynthesis